MKLSEDLANWRIGRPDEWKMDEFIKMALTLEQENEALRTGCFIVDPVDSDIEDNGGECVTLGEVPAKRWVGFVSTELQLLLYSDEGYTVDDMAACLVHDAGAAP